MVTLLTVISSESRIYISLTLQGNILVRRLYKGAFRYPKYHPDVASAFAFRISRFLMILLGLIFCSTFSPKGWDPFARARTYLTKALSHRRDLYDKYEYIIDRVKFCKRPTSATTFPNAITDTFNKGVLDFVRTTYHIFVDDSLFANIESTIKYAMVANIEILYLVLRFSDETV